MSNRRVYDYVLGLDPSGAYHEGKGTTGWVLVNKFGRVQEKGFITAHNFTEPEAFWQAHHILIAAMWEHYQDQLMVVVEDFLLYPDKAMSQVNSRMETCRLIGSIQVFCYESDIPITLQRAVDVKGRWSYDVLINKKIIESHTTYFTLVDSGERINRHELDALRHALHFVTFKQETQAPTAPKPSKRLAQFYNYKDRPWEGDRKE